MGVVMNCLDEENKVVVGGEHFHFKPNQIKYFYNNAISSSLLRIYQEHGFIELPEGLQEKEMQESEEGKKIIAEARKEGIERYCDKLRGQIYNLQVSLKRDLDQKNYKVDPRVYASKGDIKAMEQLVKYQSKNEDATQRQVEYLKDLEKKLAKGN